MAKNKYFTNRKVFWQAARNAQWLLAQGFNAFADNPLTTNVEYDRRNLSDLAALLIDVSGVPEDQKETYFKAEAKKIFHAFDTPSKDDPKKSDPELIKPYIKQMFEKVATDLDKVDYNDVNQLTNLFVTMRSVQMLATMVENFPQEASELYPTPEEKAKIDAISAKAYIAFLEGRVRISEQGLDDVAEILSLNPGSSVDHSYFVTANITNALGDAKTNNTSVMLDPTSDDMMADYLYGADFTKTNWARLPDGTSRNDPYTQDDCIKTVLGALVGAHSNTSMEHVVMRHLISEQSYPETISEKELLLINGKSIKEIHNELMAQGMTENEAELEAGKILRGALTDGQSKVSLLSATLETNGEMTVAARDIKVDLDKLNDIARKKEHNWFRRALHSLGWKIPDKYPSNDTRDLNLANKELDVNSDHSKGVEAMKQRIRDKFNALPRPFLVGKRNMVDLVPKARLVDAQNPELDKFRDKNVPGYDGPQESMDFDRKPESERVSLIEPDPAYVNIIDEQPQQNRQEIRKEPYNIIADDNSSVDDNIIAQDDEEARRQAEVEEYLSGEAEYTRVPLRDPEFWSNGPQETMDFRKDPAEEPPKVEEAPKEEAPKEEAPKEEAPKQEEAPKEEAPKEEEVKQEEVKQPVIREKSQNELGAEQSLADPQVKADMMAKFNEVTSAATMEPMFAGSAMKPTDRMKSMMKNMTLDIFYKDAAEFIGKMWEATDSKNPEDVKAAMAEQCRNIFYRAESSMSKFGLPTMERFVAAQQMTDMMINRFSPVAFDKNLATYGDMYFLNHTSLDAIGVLAQTDDFYKQRELLTGAQNTIIRSREHLDLSKEFNNKEDVKEPKIDERNAPDKNRIKE